MSASGPDERGWFIEPTSGRSFVLTERGVWDRAREEDAERLDLPRYWDPDACGWHTRRELDDGER